MIHAEAFAVYDDGRTGDCFAVGVGETHRKALWDLQAYHADAWRRAEHDPEVVGVTVEVRPATDDSEAPLGRWPGGGPIVPSDL